MKRLKDGVCLLSGVLVSEANIGKPFGSFLVPSNKLGFSASRGLLALVQEHQVMSVTNVALTRLRKYSTFRMNDSGPLKQGV